MLVSDPATAVTSEMDAALKVGSSGAKLVLLNGANPQVPVGTVAPNAVQVQVVDLGDGTPVVGGTVLFAAPATAAIVGCSASPCPVITDQNGLASAQILVKQPGSSIITASLPTGESVSGTVNGLAATLEITVAQPTAYVGKGVSAVVPISALVVGNGVPVAGATVNFLKNFGSAVISPASSITSTSGIASSAITVNAITSDVNLSACVAPGNTPCRTVIVHPVDDVDLHLQRVSGDNQMIAVGQRFSPVVLRVTDPTGNPVEGVPVTFDVQVIAATGPPVQVTTGEVVTTHTVDPITLSSSTVTIVSDTNGLASLPAMIAPPQAAQVVVRATAGHAEIDLELQSLWMDFPSNPQPTKVHTPLRRRVPVSKLRTLRAR